MSTPGKKEESYPSSEWLETTIEDIQDLIENKADGQILSVDDIEVSLIGGVSPTQKCTERTFNQQGDILKLNPGVKLVDLNLRKDQKLFLLGCNLDIYQNLAETEEYVKRSFTSKITYSYAIKKEERFNPYMLRANRNIAKTD